MCIFSDEVESVSSTNIFARLQEANRQVLVYSMEVSAAKPVAMILPIPVQFGAAEDNVKFIDLSSYPDFFDDLSSAFPKLRSRGFSFNDEDMLCASSSILEVHDVGEFEASYVPTIDDFDRLDKRFRLPSAVVGDRRYADFGFVVFKFKEGHRHVHPMAFSFETRCPERLFFPTVHVHDSYMKKEDHFDHTLYCQKKSLSRTNEPTCWPDWTASVLLGRDVMKEEAKKVINRKGPFFKLDLHGIFPNQDFFVEN